jgi:hypothetical protein
LYFLQAFINFVTLPGTTVDIIDEETETIPSRYQYAIKYLTGQDPSTGKKRIDCYVEKQAAYVSAVERKVKAFNDALERATHDPENTTIALQRAAYDKFIFENSRAYRRHVQAAFMDLVSNGKKQEVEYWFSAVHHQNALARIQASKVGL